MASALRKAKESNNKKPRSVGWVGNAELLYEFDQPGTWIANLSWSPDGEQLAAAAQMGNIRVWDVATGNLRFRITTQDFHIFNILWSPNGKILAASTEKNGVFFLDASSGRSLGPLDSPSRKTPIEVMGLAWSPKGRTLALGTEGSVELWDVKTRNLRYRFPEQRAVIAVRFSPNGRYLAATSYDNTICIFDLHSKKLTLRLSEATYSPALEWSPDSKLIVSAIGAAVGVWDAATGQLRYVLEGHSGQIRAVSFSSDGKLLASRGGPTISEEGPPGTDPYVILWRTDDWKLCAKFPEHSSAYIFSGLAFSPTQPLLATSTKEDLAVHVWKLSFRHFRQKQPKRIDAAYYRNAKVALVGDSGVGKSALALVLTKHKFAGTESTHGRKVSLLAAERVPKSGGETELRETVLWDLAGQPGYRLIHQLHLGDLAVAAIVFDSRNELDPFAGVRHWNRALLQAARFRLRDSKPPRRILVAARIDRGTVGVSRARVASLMSALGIDDYIETSAKEGIGITRLRDAILHRIDWDDFAAVSSHVLFQRMKGFILNEKRCGRVLGTGEKLFKAFSETLKRTIERSEFSVSIERLESLGLIRRFSFGDLILLEPEMLDGVASAVVSAARREPDGMGSIREGLVRAGQFILPKSARLKNKKHMQLLIVATTEDLIAHEIAFRESSADGAVLVFPSQLTRENPELPDPAGKEVEIKFEGPVLNIYATLVVRLAHSGSFKLHELWKNAATYASGNGGVCGLFLTEEDEGKAAITLFYERDISMGDKIRFDEFISSHIARMALPGSIKKLVAAVCTNPECLTPVTTIAALRRKERGFDWIPCNVCGERIQLVWPQPTAPGTVAVIEMDRSADERKDIETALISASGEMLTSSFRRWAGGEKATVAIVFTDIVESTMMAAKLGDEGMAHLRRAHFTQTRKLIEKHKGYEIKTIGDSFMIAFRTAVDALSFAIALRRETGHSDINIRAGVHVGPVHIEEEDAFGNMVNYAARVIGYIHGTEICVSDRAYRDIEMERAASHQRLCWQERQNVVLKGFAKEHTLWVLPK
jgi:WD40 repeat protein/class 3 adenylate cyclase